MYKVSKLQEVYYFFVHKHLQSRRSWSVGRTQALTVLGLSHQVTHSNQPKRENIIEEKLFMGEHLTKTQYMQINWGTSTGENGSKKLNIYLSLRESLDQFSRLHV